MLGALGLGGSKKKSSDLVPTTAAALQQLASPQARASEKAAEDASKCLLQIKAILYGDASAGEPNADQVDQLVGELLAHNIIPLLISELSKLEFEAKKDVAQIFNNLLRKTQAPGRNSVVDYILHHVEILGNLVAGYDNADIALTCGLMLRECIRHEALARLVLHSDLFYRFFEYVEVANFDVASDAFATFKDLLVLHKQMSAAFLEENYPRVFASYTGLLNSGNYVTRRQSLKLLGELLLDRANFNIMTRYISDSANLKLMMNLLRDKSKSIQFEAFHVFKVFVANPKKTKPIYDILHKNQDRLVAFLSNFQNEKEDETFKEEKAFLIRQIQQLQPPVEG